MPSSLFNPVDKKTGAAISEDNAISELDDLPEEL